MTVGGYRVQKDNRRTDGGYIEQMEDTCKRTKEMFREDREDTD
jgi:hypothetical protein